MVEVAVVVTGGKVVVLIIVVGGRVRVVTEGVRVRYSMTGVVVVMKEVLVRNTGGKVVVVVTTCGGSVTTGPGTVLNSVNLDTTGEVTVIFDV